MSILENKNINTYVSFYFLISKDFENDINILLIFFDLKVFFINIFFIIKTRLSTYEQYDLFTITFYRMDNRFNNVKKFRYITKSDYFK